MNPFNLLKSKWKFVFDIYSSIGIMGQFFMHMKTIVLISKSKGLVPFNPQYLPFLKPIEFSPRPDEELKFHLFKLAHSENELPGNNLIPKGFTNLSNTKRYFHSSRFLDIQVIDKNSLSCFGTEINL